MSGPGGRARPRLSSLGPVDERVTEAAIGAEFGSSRAFSEHGASRLGMAPSRFRGGGAGLEVAYTVVASPLGLVLVAATGRGVCAVRLGGDEAALVAELAAELPGAVRRRDDAGLAETAAVVVAATTGAPGATSLPLEQLGTAFQAVVWEALRAIPLGETRSYAAVAAAIGRPSATRAVAGACAANPVLLAVPCHRVVRSDGSLGGFRYGTAVKAALLEAEAAGSPQRGASPRR